MTNRRFPPARKKALTRQSTRLYLEWLEGRCLPSTVTNLTDRDPGSLRDAIATTPPGGIVDFEPDLFGFLTLTSAPLTIVNDLSIIGPGSDRITVGGNQAFQVFTVARAVRVTISGLTIADGKAFLFGGGIANEGTLTLRDSALSDNSSGNRGGGVYNGLSATLIVSNCTFSGNETSNAGGSIYNIGALSLSNSTFFTNGGKGADGGAIYNVGRLWAANCSLFGNGGPDAFGGAVRNDGEMSVDSSILSGNAANLGGGIYNNGTLLVSQNTFSGDDAGNGGGIFNNGTLTVNSSMFSVDSAASSGGGIDNSASGTAVISDSTFSANTITALDGCGICNLGKLTISNSHIYGNSGYFALGGGIYNSGTLMVSDCILSDNGAREGHGGGLYNTGMVTIHGSTIAKNRVGGDGGGILNRGSLSVDDSTISENNGLAGGGIYNEGGTLALSNCMITDNAALDGGGGAVASDGTLAIDSSTMSGNSAYSIGSSIWMSGGSLQLGNSTISGMTASGISFGGILLLGSSSGQSTVSDCTISGNNSYGGTIINVGTLTISNSTISSNNGRGLGSGGGITNSGTLTVSGTTISGNSDNDANSAGGIFNSGKLTVSNSTITGNSSPLTGDDRSAHAGGIANFGILMLFDSTLSGNTVGSADRSASQLFCGRLRQDATCQLRNTIFSGDGSRPNLFAGVGRTFLSLGHNLSSDDGSGFLTSPGDLVNTDPLLGPLQDNGGPTQTMALLPGSPAIDAGDNTNAPDFDQRGPGFPRIVGGVIDIGAFEVQQGPATQFQLTAPAQATSNTPLDVTVTALDAYGHTAAGYLGMVGFGTSDADVGVMLPADYTFTPADGGVHSFPAGVLLITPGNQTLTVTDSNGLTGSTSILVTAPAPPPSLGSPTANDPVAEITVDPLLRDTLWSALPEATAILGHASTALGEPHAGDVVQALSQTNRRGADWPDWPLSRWPNVLDLA